MGLLLARVEIMVIEALGGGFTVVCDYLIIEATPSLLLLRSCCYMHAATTDQFASLGAPRPNPTQADGKTKKGEWFERASTKTKEPDCAGRSLLHEW